MTKQEIIKAMIKCKQLNAEVDATDSKKKTKELELEYRRIIEEFDQIKLKYPYTVEETYKEEGEISISQIIEDFLFSKSTNAEAFLKNYFDELDLDTDTYNDPVDRTVHIGAIQYADGTIFS